MDSGRESDAVLIAEYGDDDGRLPHSLRHFHEAAEQIHRLRERQKPEGPIDGGIVSDQPPG